MYASNYTPERYKMKHLLTVGVRISDYRVCKMFCISSSIMGVLSQFREHKRGSLEGRAQGRGG